MYDIELAPRNVIDLEKLTDRELSHLWTSLRIKVEGPQALKEAEEFNSRSKEQRTVDVLNLLRSNETEGHVVRAVNTAAGAHLEDVARDIEGMLNVMLAAGLTTYATYAINGGTVAMAYRDVAPKPTLRDAVRGFNSSLLDTPSILSLSKVMTKLEIATINNGSVSKEEVRKLSNEQLSSYNPGTLRSMITEVDRRAEKHRQDEKAQLLGGDCKCIYLYDKLREAIEQRLTTQLS